MMLVLRWLLFSGLKKLKDILGIVADPYLASSLLFLIIQFIGIFVNFCVDFFSFKDIL
jgi:hypothetical protein